MAKRGKRRVRADGTIAGLQSRTISITLDQGAKRDLMNYLKEHP